MHFSKVRAEMKSLGGRSPAVPVEEAARLLGVPLKTLDAMARSALLSVTMVAGQRVLVRSEIRRLRAMH